MHWDGKVFLYYAPTGASSCYTYAVHSTNGTLDGYQYDDTHAYPRAKGGFSHEFSLLLDHYPPTHGAPAKPIPQGWSLYSSPEKPLMKGGLELVEWRCDLNAAGYLNEATLRAAWVTRDDTRLATLKATLSLLAPRLMKECDEYIGEAEKIRIEEREKTMQEGKQLLYA